MKKDQAADIPIVKDLREWFSHHSITSDHLVFWALWIAFFGMPLGTSFPTIFGIAACIFWLASGNCFRAKDVVKQRWFFPILFLILLHWIGLLYTPDASDMGWAYAKKTHHWITCLALATLPFAVFSPRYFIRAFLYGLALNALIGMVQFIGILPTRGGWYSGLGRGYSTLSAYLIIGMLMAAYYFGMTEDKKNRIIYAVLIGLYFFQLIILHGRAGYLTFAVLSPLMIHNMFKKLNMLKIMALCLICIALMMLSPIVRERVVLSVEQLSYHIQADPDKAWGKEYTTQQDRFYMWYGAVRIFRDHPIIGIGTGGYTTVLKNMGAPENSEMAHPHNDFLYMASSFGIFGIICYIWFFAELVRNSWKARESPTGMFVFATAWVVIVSGGFNAQLLDIGMIFLLSVTVGLQQAFPEFDSNMPKQAFIVD